MSKTKKIKSALPKLVSDRIKTLGENLMIARKRRGYSQEHLAQLVLVDRNTIRRLEKGDAGVSIAVLATTLWVLQMDDAFALLARPDQDRLGLSLSQDAIKQRIHMKPEKDDHDF